MTGRKSPFSNTQSQRPQFSTTGSAIPSATGLHAAHRAAVGDDEHAPAGMAFRDAPQRPQHPLLVCLRRLAHELDPVALDAGQTLPGSPVLLAQARVDDHAQPEPHADDLRRLARPGEIARVDRVELFLRQLLGELPSLPSAEVAEGAVGVPLETPVGVPVGLAVANE